VTLTPPAHGEQDAAAGVTVPANGLTFVVDCGGSPQPLVIRVNLSWFSAFDCSGLGVDVATSLALRPADYHRFDLRAGQLVTVEVTDIDTEGDVVDREPWRVRVKAGLPAVSRPVVPRPVRLTSDPPPDALKSFVPTKGSINGELEWSGTIPPQGVDVIITCLYPGTIRFEARDASGSPVGGGVERCTGIIWSNGEGVQITRDSLIGSGPAGRRLTLRVTAAGFVHRSWRVDVVPASPRR
jgi:hypothetical protein